MKKEYRIRKNWEFQAIIEAKNQVLNRELILYFKKADSFKIGISIPKKFANAVQRNYLRRQVRSILLKLNVFEFAYHFVIIVRKQFLELDFNTKLESVKKLFGKVEKYGKSTSL
ncbi:ribonuclease P protein component [Mycoplasmopsis californica]|uniref:Ribonuclease P protein component n=1 Tax=Mycoplasmopsis equigenitalium TaxID=114883 RepID=A0ABY5J1E1_9BACT|nr:ribonuclease P protein component [Mycoplasmopsis equigenitalium]UUD37077.1 ribonuclease P protein component [Mycoplasmopsis equigenitalium]VEU69622.1 ribonuclease P protein component [Mycoplasmopsis californica]